jgi:talin
MKQWPLTALRRWVGASNSTVFTLDFGNHEQEYRSLLTKQGDAISAMISGYIDIILKTRKGIQRIPLLSVLGFLLIRFFSCF